MKTVRFTQMKDGTKSEYEMLARLERTHIARTASRVLRELSRQDEESLPGYRISRLEHALQTATRALEDKASIDWIVSALLHDIGDGLAPENHDRFAGELIRPYVSEECTWVVSNHGLFQTYYYGHHLGWDRNARDRLADHPGFKSCVDFCERWDQSSFDPDYKSKPLSFFAPMVEEVFARPAYAADIIRQGAYNGLG